MVGRAAGALEVGVTSGAGAPKANVKKKADSWRANMSRMASMIWTMKVNKGYSMSNILDNKTAYSHSSYHTKALLSLLE